MAEIEQIGFGGGCHWCTEGVFNQILGVTKVRQGYIKGDGENDSWSEAVLVSYNSNEISLQELLAIYLRSHAATSAHSMRKKYRSAVYYLDETDEVRICEFLAMEQKHFGEKLITKALKFTAFEESRESLRDYYRRNPDAPFCQRYIDPKIAKLRKDYRIIMKAEV